MKKFGLLCLALVLALGAVGVGYAMWTDTIWIDGTVQTGSVSLGIEADSYAEVNSCPASEYAATPDRNWSGWVYTIGVEGCPPNYRFATRPCTDKDVAWVTFTAMQADGTVILNPSAPGAPVIERLKVTIHNAYPHYLAWITFHIYNAGTIPLHIQPAVIDQDPFLLIQYNNGVFQLEPGVPHEISMYVGVVQHQGYFADENDPSSYVVDDPAMPLLPMNAGRGEDGDPPALEFTITIEGVQWAE
jgi:hypothetical protein